MKHRSGLFLLFGLWLSFIGLLVGGATLLPVTKNVHALSPAAVYRAALHEEMREATTLPTLGKVIVVDQSGMKLSLYQDGTSTKAFRITALAAPHSLYEVPSGSYSVAGKEPQHFSERSRLWMPYAISFGDSLFIHGIPQSASGDDVKTAEGVSVELATLDAQEVYEFAEVGAKIIATGGYPRALYPPVPRYYLEGEGKLPKVTAPSFIVTDIDSGDVLWERSADTEKEQGRLASFAVALTALETLDQYQNVRMGKLLLPGNAAEVSPPSRDDELPLGSLIYPLLFDANQTASAALRSVKGDSAFTQSMNDRAKSLGMLHTAFDVTSPLDAGTTSVRDLFTLLRHVYEREHFLLDVSLSSDHAIFASSGRMRYEWQNKNPWVMHGDADYQGGFGALSLGGNGSAMLLFSASPAEFSKRTVAFVLLDSADIEADIAVLRTFIKEHYRFGVRREEEPAAFGRTETILERIKRLLRTDITYDRDV